MVDPPALEDVRRTRFLIPDTTPLSLLALIGEAGLDWLFLPRAEVWITDMVREEALRDPPPGGDARLRHRATMRAWFASNQYRIRIQETREGEEYRKATRAWELAGSPPELRPSWADRGEASVLQVLDAAARAAAAGEGVVVIADDRDARAALSLREDLDIDLMGTESFIAWMATAFGVTTAETAWQAIRLASGGSAPTMPNADPVYIRRPDRPE